MRKVKNLDLIIIRNSLKNENTGGKNIIITFESNKNPILRNSLKPLTSMLRFGHGCLQFFILAARPALK
jgi:hypothetical protein